MKWITHLSTALIFGYLVSQFIPLSVGGLIILATCSILPDYFEMLLKTRHRSKYFHNALIPMASMFLIVNPTLAGIPLGYGHHLLLDSLTKQGIYVGKDRVKGFMYSNNLASNVFVVFIHVLLLFMNLFFVY